jgi:hypothetical protein
MGHLIPAGTGFIGNCSFNVFETEKPVFVPRSKRHEEDEEPVMEREIGGVQV